jgi:hypothetical protein
MAKKKIDLTQLDQLIKDGKSAKEVQEFFRVSPVAIWKARKRLGLTIAKTLTPETTQRIIEGDLDFLGRMRKLTQTINDQLKKAEADVLTSTGAEKRAFQEIVIKLASEGRKQIETVLHVAQIWYSHRALADFMEETSDYLDDLSPGFRKRVMEGLQQRHALRLSQKKEERRYGSKTATKG